MKYTKLLSSNAFWVINKHLAKQIGLFETLLLADLISKYEFFEARNELDNKGGFFNTEKDLIKTLPIGIKKIRSTKKNLVDLNIVFIKKRGVPSKHFYYINFKKIDDLVITSSSPRATTGDAPRATTSSGSRVTTINKNKKQEQTNKNKKSIVLPKSFLDLFSEIKEVSGKDYKVLDNYYKHYKQSLKTFSHAEIRKAVLYYLKMDCFNKPNKADNFSIALKTPLGNLEKIEQYSQMYKETNVQKKHDFNIGWMDAKEKKGLEKWINDGGSPDEYELNVKKMRIEKGETQWN